MFKKPTDDIVLFSERAQNAAEVLLLYVDIVTVNTVDRYSRLTKAKGRVTTCFLLLREAVSVTLGSFLLERNGQKSMACFTDYDSRKAILVIIKYEMCHFPKLVVNNGLRCMADDQRTQMNTKIRLI